MTRNKVMQMAEAARKATSELRDAAREGRIIEFRQRYPLVLAIHAVIDAFERETNREGNST